LNTAELRRFHDTRPVKIPERNSVQIANNPYFRDFRGKDWERLDNDFLPGCSFATKRKNESSLPETLENRKREKEAV